MSVPTFALLSKRLRHEGLRWLAGAVRDRVYPARPTCHDIARAALQNKHAVEIGGPSRIFRARGGLPAYAWLKGVDNVNFASATAWENQLSDGGAFLFNKDSPPGRQFLREAVALTGIPDCAYDVVLSSHCLEHVANPLGALREWHRVVRPGGYLLIVLPNPAHTFDHRRPITTLAHLAEDYHRGTPETDLMHLEEILATHDLGRDPAAGSFAQFAARAKDNARHRCLHHHVFNTDLMRDALNKTGWRVISAEPLAPIHLLAFAKKPTAP